MKVAHAIGFVVFISISTFSDFILKNDLDRDNLNGPVKRVITHSYKAMIDSGRIKKIDALSFDKKTISNYDVNGNCYAKYTYRKDELFEEKIAIKHDEKGKKIEEFYYDSKDSLKQRIVFNYNEEGRHLNTKTFNGKDELISRTGATYDDSGKHEYEEKHFDSRGKLIDAWNYKRSESLDKMEMKHFNRKNRMIGNWILIYNEKGNLIESNSIFLKNKQSSKLVFKYSNSDTFSNWTRRTRSVISKDRRNKMLGNGNKKNNGSSDTTYTIEERKIEYYNDEHLNQ